MARGNVDTREITLHNALEDIRGSTIKQRDEGLRSRQRAAPFSFRLCLILTNIQVSKQFSIELPRRKICRSCEGPSWSVCSDPFLATFSQTKHTTKSSKISSESFSPRNRVSFPQERPPSPVPSLDCRRAPMPFVL